MRATSKFLVLAGALACGILPGTAIAQDPSTTDTLSDYTSTLPTVTTPATTTPATTTPATTTPTTPEAATTPEAETAPTTTTNEVAGQVVSGGDEPTTGTATPPESTPRALAFTGADSVLLLLLGAALAGSALWLLRRGNRSS